ncbi:metal-dependent hydrolase [bacterium]|nr:metal-dependent hydrolase [bacterium]
MYVKPLFISYFLLSCCTPLLALELTWFGHSAFRMKSKELVLLIDPWLTNLKNPNGSEILSKIGKVDYILLSHGHGDHLGNTKDLLETTSARVVTSYGLGNQLIQLMEFPPHRVSQELLGDVGGSVRLGNDAIVHFINARHSSEVVDTKGTIHYGGPAIGFLIQFREGKTIYHTGDTDLYLDMKLIPAFYPVDILLTCIGGQFTMDPKRAALATALISPKLVIPMHYGTYPLLKGTTEEFLTEIGQVEFDGKLRVLEINKMYEF